MNVSLSFEILDDEILEKSGCKVSIAVLNSNSSNRMILLINGYLASQSQRQENPVNHLDSSNLLNVNQVTLSLT
jgi:hypothetical protein